MAKALIEDGSQNPLLAVDVPIRPSIARHAVASAHPADNNDLGELSRHRCDVEQKGIAGKPSGTGVCGRARKPARGLVRAWYELRRVEGAQDGVRLAYGNLDVVALAEARTLVKWTSLGKEAAHRVERLDA